ncbi:MAG: homoserine dehydrogenase [Candidatus Velthaea sp.]
MPVGIGLLGCGTVGGGVAQLLAINAAAIARSGGTPFSLVAVAVRDAGKPRAAALPPGILGTDASGVIDRADVQLVVECIGGTGVAKDLVERALERGKHVVTANKDLLATEGPRLAALAARRGVTLHYEAAVGGAIPIVRALADSLAGEDVLEVGGVLNGTTNFILSEMTRGASYAGALAEAQRLGFAEADPTSDVAGIDAAHKLAILAQLAFKLAVTSPQIGRRGITDVSRDDVSLGARLGWKLKLIACARSGEELSASVTPAYVPSGHAFAQPVGPHNCIRVIGRASGTLTFAGAGAGGDPTASAVIGDIVAALRRIAGVPGEAAILAPVSARTLAALRLPHVVRVPSLRDARPAENALAAAGHAARAEREAPAVIVAPISIDGAPALARVLENRGIVAASVLPLWDDGIGHAAIAADVA